jgi:hypothetical protein
MIPGLDTFSNMRVDGVMEQLQDIRQKPRQLLFLNRTASVPSNGTEIMARFHGRAQISDIIADDAPAVAYSFGKVDFANVNIPKIKHGAVFNESDMRQLLQFRSLALRGDRDAVAQLEMTRDAVVDNLLLGVRWRQEALLVAMALDSFHYDRLGIKIDGTWGMPSDLKVTVSPYWTDASNATPIANILTMKLLGSEKYGQEYNRLTMSTTAFRYMIATTEFANKAEVQMRPDLAFTQLDQRGLEPMTRIAEALTGCTIVLYDGRWWTQGAPGAANSVVPTSGRFLPLNKVILDSSQNDNNRMVTDLANEVPIESMLMGMAGMTTEMGSIPAGRPGPMAYAHVPPLGGNAPSMSMWAVARSYPRKWERAANAVLTVGNFDELIPIADPF